MSGEYGFALLLTRQFVKLEKMGEVSLMGFENFSEARIMLFQLLPLVFEQK